MAIDPRLAYILQFSRSLRVWKEKNPSHKICVQQARMSAKRMHTLTESEQRDVDEFLKDELKPEKPISPSMGASEAIHVDYEID